MILSALIGFPLVAAVLVAVFGRSRPSTARSVALAASVAELALAAVATWELVSRGGLALVETAGAGSLWNLSMDGLAAPLVVLTAVLTVIAVLASWRVTRAPAAMMALLLCLEAAVVGVFLAANVFVFYAAWEAVLVPMFFLIGVWGHEDRQHAAMKFFLYTFAGSALMLLGLIIAVLGAHGTSFAVLIANTPASLQPIVFWLLLAGFLVKIPAWPLHTWLPDAHVEAPTAGSIMLAGVLLKMGGYGLLRLALPVAPATFHQWAWLLATIGAIGIVYGALLALAQSDLKRLVAYSSVSHMGFVLVAVATGTALGAGAALLVMVSHGLVSALLFLLVGTMYDRTHTRTIADLGGLGRAVPVWSVAFVFAALASLGLPGLSGFPGELLTVLTSWGPFATVAAAAALGALLAAGYNLWAVSRVSYGTARETWSGLADLALHEGVAVGTLAIGIVVLGIAPGLVLTVAEPFTRALGALLGGTP